MERTYMSKTSTDVKNRWNAKHYSQLTFRLEKNLVEKFKKKCKSENIPMAEILRDAIRKFLET